MDPRKHSFSTPLLSFKAGILLNSLSLFFLCLLRLSFLKKCRGHLIGAPAVLTDNSLLVNLRSKIVASKCAGCHKHSTDKNNDV